MPDIHRLIGLLQSNDWLPCIVFTFSRKEVESRAFQLMEYYSLTTKQEQEDIKEVFNNAIESLNEFDRQLTVIQQMLPMLQRGIGVHHSGYNTKKFHFFFLFCFVFCGGCFC